MADGGYDPCECIWNHENNMQRLMNLLRNSQSYCTDNQCVQDTPGPQGTPADGGYSTMMMMMIGWLVVATALFLLRPSTMRSRGDVKPARSDQGGDDHNPPGIH